MNNLIMLEQQKKALQKTIQTEGLRLNYCIYPLKDNGLGTMVFDYDQAQIETEIYARVALEARQPAVDTGKPSGLSTNLNRIIITDYRTALLQDGIIKGLEREYKIGAVTPLIKFGGIYGYQAVLIEGTT